MEIVPVDSIWPHGTPHTGASYRRGDYRFMTTPPQAFRQLSHHLRLWDVADVSLGIDVDVSERTGKPRWYMLTSSSDPSVALSFKRYGKRITLALDTYNSAAANLRAIGLTVAAMRSIDRYGADVLLDRMVAPMAKEQAIQDDVIYLSKG